MAGRKIILATDYCYHIFNRGVARQPVFFTKRDYARFITTISYYRFLKPPLKLSRFLSLPQKKRLQVNEQIDSLSALVTILAFVCMPNHIHFLLKQTADKGITKFMSLVTNSYTRYINTKHQRVGDLFQGVFKAVRVETDEQLLHLSRYIHLNPVVSPVIKNSELFSFPWSSLPNYLKKTSSVVDPTLVMNQFKNVESYKSFLLDQIDYGKRLEEIKHLLHDE